MVWIYRIASQAEIFASSSSSSLQTPEHPKKWFLITGVMWNAEQGLQWESGDSAQSEMPFHIVVGEKQWHQPNKII